MSKRKEIDWPIKENFVISKKFNIREIVNDYNILIRTF